MKFYTNKNGRWSIRLNVIEWVRDKFTCIYEPFIYIDESSGTKRWTKEVTGVIRWVEPVTVSGLTENIRTKKAFKLLYKRNPELKGFYRLF